MAVTSPRSLLFAAGAALALAAAAPARAADAPGPTLLTLSAQGSVKAQPDEATLSVGVRTDAPDAAAALADNARRMTEVFAALRRAGIADRNVQTSGVSLQPTYEYPAGQAQKLVGYSATNTVSVEVLDLARLGDVIDSTVASGSNQIGGVAFGLRDPSAAEDAARTEAVRILAARADLYAKAAGLKVLRLRSLTESGAELQGPVRPMMLKAAAPMAQTPVSAGQVQFGVSVEAVYELAP